MNASDHSSEPQHSSFLQLYDLWLRIIPPWTCCFLYVHNREMARDISRPLDSVWHPTFISTLSANVIQDSLQAQFSDSLNACREDIGLDGVISHAPPRERGRHPSRYHSGTNCLLVVSINDLSLSLEYPLFHFTDDFTLGRTGSPLPSRLWRNPSLTILRK